jgi:ABC-type dipeptide/oligopeptide/nickel transport system permease component
MKKVRIIAILIGTFISLPIGFWLQYKTLKMIQASELMMFLFWVNMPLIVFVQTIVRIFETPENK